LALKSGIGYPNKENNGIEPMISHQYQCIFIHIPRTAGSSIEQWICGEDWWLIDPATKHLTAHQAKLCYKDYWDQYYKFSFVRNPWDRMISCLRFPKYFRIEYSDKILNFGGYETKFGKPLTLEFDHRFLEFRCSLRDRHQENQVYLNILDEPLDFIGRMETLEKDVAFLQDQLGIEKPFNNRAEASTDRKRYQDYYDTNSRRWVAETFRGDIVRFGYTF
jgi:hypothetical protein